LKIPLVFQLNKRDLPNALPVKALREALPWPGAAHFESVAPQGKGVPEAMRALLAKVKQSRGR
jgi:signal recognition particle receptor subunit beta